MKRTDLSRWCAFFVLCAGSASAYADPLPLPSPDETDRLRSRLDWSPQGFTADRCTIEGGRLACEGVRRGSDCAASWSEGVATELYLELDASRWWVEEAVRTDIGWVLRGVVRQADGADEIETTQWAGAVIGDQEMTLQEGSWGTAPAASGDCPATPRVDLPVATVGNARWGQQGWTFEDVRVPPWPIGPVQRQARGFLPPTVRAANGVVGGHLDYWLAPFAALTVLGDSDGHVGVGIGVVSGDARRTRRLDGLLQYDVVQRRLEPAALGDLGVGRRLHLRAHLEHPADDTAWRLRRNELGGLYRDWRVTDVGVSLGGRGHSLYGRFSALTDPSEIETQLAADLGFASDFDASFSRWSVDLDHSTRRLVDSIHSSTAAVEAAIPFGRPEAFWVTPSAAVVGNFGTVTAARGFDASTTFSILGRAEAGLAFDGRFETARHYVSPRLYAGAELFGLQQRTPEEGAPPFPYQRPDRWRYVDLVLDQNIREGDWSLAFPVGVYTDTLGDAAIEDIIADPRPHATLEGRWQNTSLRALAACDFGCAGVGFDAQLMMALSTFDVWYGVSDLDEAAARLVRAPQLLSRAGTAVRLVQPASADLDAIVHYGGIGFSGSHWNGSASARWSDAEPERGFDGTFGYHWPLLGWGLGASGGWRLDGEWNVIAGLSLNPAR